MALPAVLADLQRPRVVLRPHPVARIAVLGSAGILTANVALITGCVQVIALQRKRQLIVLKICILPGRIRIIMTALAEYRIARLPVIGIDGRVVIGLVARRAVRRCARGLEVGMACRTLLLRVQPFQRQRCRALAVRPIGREPSRGTVALPAVPADLQRPRIVLPALPVTGIAVLWRARPLLVYMALAAIQIIMFSNEWKFGARMVEIPFSPGSLFVEMAELALLGI